VKLIENSALSSQLRQSNEMSSNAQFPLVKHIQSTEVLELLTELFAPPW
jgi:hypothetical protein